MPLTETTEQREAERTELERRDRDRANRYWWIGLFIALALVVIWAILWPLTNILATRDVSGYATAVRGAHLQSAREAVRTQLLTLGAGLFAAAALIYTARNFTLARNQYELARKSAQDSADAERRTLELTERGQVTDRYSKAIEQLGSDKLDVRIGGIYALERIARDSAGDHPTVIEVLSAFIREHSREQWPPAEPDVETRERVVRDAAGDHPTVIKMLSAFIREHSPEQRPPPAPDGDTTKRATRPDVQAALTVIGRRNREHDVRQCDLSGAVLVRANLVEANLAYADLTYANLTYAEVRGANLTSAALTFADLTHADLHDAILTGAYFTGATLKYTALIRADLTKADLRGGVLTGAHLFKADLTDAMWPEFGSVPDGWVRDRDSGRLSRAEKSDEPTAEAVPS